MSQETPIQDAMTIQDMDTLVKKMFELRAQIEERDSITSEMNKELAAMQAKAVTALKALERDSYKSEAGTVSIVHKWRVSVPATDEAKKELFYYMKEKGLLYRYATVNSNSLNSFFMAEWEAAQGRGEGMDFKMPGIADPKLHETVAMRKK